MTQQCRRRGRTTQRNAQTHHERDLAGSHTRRLVQSGAGRVTGCETGSGSSRWHGSVQVRVRGEEVHLRPATWLGFGFGFGFGLGLGLG